MGVDGKALTVTGIGIVFLWSGIKGWSVMGTITDAITGKRPTGSNQLPLSDPNYNPATSTGGLSSPGGLAGAFNSLTAQYAIQYQGHAYAYGGAPGKDGSQPWDCSSFTNWIRGIKMGASIPGYGPGKYDGSSHGPTTIQWGAWSGLKTINRNEVAAGDLVIWTGHMGICLDSSTMISALNQQAGTKVTEIDGHGNGPLIRFGRFI